MQMGGVLGLLTSTSLLLLVMLSCFLPRFCVAGDRILPGETLPMNETLVSAGGTFALGFFTLGASSPPRRYLGIWYNNLPGDRTVVWVANREKPFSAGSSVVLRLSNDSNLEVTNSADAVVWSTNTAAGGGAALGSMTAVLLDSGNLQVLLNTDNSLIWQSFDDFGNTGLPGMRMRLDTTTGRGDRYLSWKSADDPAPGSFTMGIDPATVVQMIIWKDNRTFWRSIVGSSDNFWADSFSIQSTPGTSVSITFTSSPFAPLRNPTLQRIYLDHDGIFRMLYWSSKIKQWISPFSSNRSTTACDAYGACGPNRFCNDTASWTTPACNCLSGYEPRPIPPEWNRGDHSAGCARPAGGCDQNDVFRTVDAVKLPDKMVYLKQVTSSWDCEGACRSNCSCTAYAHAYERNTYGYFITTRCFVWHGDLMDLVQYLPYSGSGAKLNFRLLLGSPPSAADKKEKAIIIDIVIAAVVVLAMLILIICLVWRYGKKTLTGFSRKWKQLVVLLLRHISSGSIQFIKNGKEEAGDHVPLQSFEFITAITNSFSDSNKLGEGGFGKVYKGVMPTGVEVAVKRLSRGSSQGQEEFKNEVALIAKLQHRNLVKLVGSCIHGEERILIYEFVPNGSLSNFIFDSIKQVELDWETRFNIIKGIARGLLYLHQDSRFKIVHRDLKASNILLDEDMNPKISDFGMARIFGGNQSRCITHRVVGTYGYMSPEYAMEGHYSVKSDVYSFGVLLLEIISGRRNNIFYRNQICLNLLTYAWHMWKEENVMGFLDPSIASTSSLAVDQVSRCLHVGLLCVQDHVNKRPFMSSIVFMLENDDTPIRDKPKRPMFMLEAAQDGGEAPRSGITCTSVNDLSITAVEGR